MSMAYWAYSSPDAPTMCVPVGPRRCSRSVCSVMAASVMGIVFVLYSRAMG